MWMQVCLGKQSKMMLSKAVVSTVLKDDDPDGHLHRRFSFTGWPQVHHGLPVLNEVWALKDSETRCLQCWIWREMGLQPVDPRKWGLRDLFPKTSFLWICGFTRSSVGKESACNAGDLRFDPWVGKIPWRRKWLPTPVILPGESHEQRSLVGPI